MKQYEQDIETKYDLIADMRAQAEDKLRKLEVQKRVLEGRSIALKQQVNFLKITVDGKTRQLQDNDAGSNLDALEQKIKQYGQTLYKLSSFITQQTCESDYRAEMHSCLDMTAQINKLVQEQVQKP